jgi:peptidoglycan biosynthesis protein MviN/MurJ (putative lipid II flippase)
MKTVLRKIWLSPITLPVLTITFFTFFSRFLGFVRQYLILRNLTEIDSDLLLSANKIPETISVVLLMGTIYSSVLPIASRIESKDRNEENLSSYLNLITLSLVLLIGVLSVLGIIFTPQLLQLTWFTSPKIWVIAQQKNLVDDYILASRILFLFPLTFAVQAIWGVFITLKKRFLVYSLAGVITNLGAIVALLVSDGSFVKVAFGMVWGAALSSLLFLYICFRDDFKPPHFSFGWFRDKYAQFKVDIWQTWKLFLPRVLVIDGFYAANLLINSISTKQGQITAFDIGNSIQGAFFIIVTSFGTVLFPDLSKTFHSSKTDRNYFWKKTKQYLWLSAGLGVLVTLVTLVGSPLIVNLFKILGQKQDNNDLIIQVAQLTSISLIFRAVREILVRYIYIRERVWQPLILSTISVVAVVLVTFVANFMKIDAALSASLGFIAYNIVWVILALIIFQKDFMEERQGKDLVVVENDNA